MVTFIGYAPLLQVKETEKEESWVCPILFYRQIALAVISKEIRLVSLLINVCNVLITRFWRQN